MVLVKAKRAALRSQIDELEEDVRFYVDLRAGKISEFSAESLHDLPDILIQARIARGMSQQMLDGLARNLVETLGNPTS